jgi:hypothetical protein
MYIDTKNMFWTHFEIYLYMKTMLLLNLWIPYDKFSKGSKFSYEGIIHVSLCAKWLYKNRDFLLRFHKTMADALIQ